MAAENIREGAIEDGEAPDIATASDDYATRFAGGTGAWFLAVQARAVLGFLPADRAILILDVGGGHNQLAEPLCRAGYRVTVHGSAPECRRRVEANPVTRGCPFLVSPAAALPVADGAFHTVVSVRMLAHYREWRALVAELCRVAQHTVIVDFSNSGGINAIAPALFGAKQKLEKNTRHWQAFRVEEIREAFARHGFREEGCCPQFLLPMVFYRALKIPALAAAIEACFRAGGLTRAFGSPVVMKLVRG